MAESLIFWNEYFFGILQRHELRFAERSPVGGTKKNRMVPPGARARSRWMLVAELTRLV